MQFHCLRVYLIVVTVVVSLRYLFPRVSGKSWCPSSFACFPSKTGQQPVLLGRWWIGFSPTLFLESLSSCHFMLNMDGKGSPDLTYYVYPDLKCKCSFLMETWVGQHLIKFYRTQTWCWVLNLHLLALYILILKQDFPWI